MFNKTFLTKNTEDIIVKFNKKDVSIPSSGKHAVFYIQLSDDKRLFFVENIEINSTKGRVNIFLVHNEYSTNSYDKNCNKLVFQTFYEVDIGHENDFMDLNYNDKLKIF